MTSHIEAARDAQEYDECEHGVPTCADCIECMKRRHADEVRALNDENEALQARLDLIAAPVEGVDVEEVLGVRDALAAATADPALVGPVPPEVRDMVLYLAGTSPALAREVAHLRATLDQERTERRAAQDALSAEAFAEMEQLRAALATAEQERDEALGRLDAVAYAEQEQIAMCVACGPCDHSDEDGCCLTCGRDMIIVADAHSADMVREHWHEADEATQRAEQERDEARARADAIMTDSVAATREVCEAANIAIRERDALRQQVAQALADLPEDMRRIETDLRAENAELRRLLDEGADIVRDYVPGFSVWLGAAEAVLAADEAKG